MGTSLRTGTEDPTGKHGQLWTHCVGYIIDRQGGGGIVMVILVWKEVNGRKISGGGEGLSSDCLCKSTVFYRTPAPIIVYYFPYITCLLYLLFLIKHVRTSG